MEAVEDPITPTRRQRRPAGEAHLAILQAAHAIRKERIEAGVTDGGPTLLELVHRSQVGYQVARALVPKLKALGHLKQVGERPVDYRNRPVAEYLPVDIQTEIESRAGHGWVDLDRCLAGWAR